MIGNIRRMLLHDGGVVRRFFILLMGLGIFLTMTFYAVLFSFNYYFDQNPSVVQVFIKPSSAPGSLKAVEGFISGYAGVQSVHFISAEEGVRFLQKVLVSPIEEMIDSTDFPSRFEVVFKNRLSPEILRSFEAEIRAFKVIDVVSYDDNGARSDGGFSMFLLLFLGMVLLSIYEFRRFLPEIRGQMVSWLLPEYRLYRVMGLSSHFMLWQWSVVLAPFILFVAWLNGFFFRFLAIFLEFDTYALNIQIGQVLSVLAVIVAGGLMLVISSKLLDKKAGNCYN